MSNVFTESFVKELTLHASVLKKCVCGQSQYGWCECPSCGRTAVVEDKGIVSYYHKNPLKRLWYKITGRH